MKLFQGVGDFFGLDIGTSSIRVVQLGRRSGEDSFSLRHFGYSSVDTQTVAGDSQRDQSRLAKAILSTVKQSGIKTNNVAIGLPSSKTFTTVVEVPKQSAAELGKTIKYQADQYVPIPIEDAKIDWGLLGVSLRDETQQEVLLSSVSNEYSESRLELIESIGLNVIAAEPDPLAVARALDTYNATAANFIVDLGELTSDLVIVFQGQPRLVRSIPVGLSSMIKAATQNLNIKDDQARQFIMRFGLAPDKLEGRIYQAIENVLENFVTELGKSVKYFQNRYNQVQIGKVIASGYASSIPMMNNYIANHVNLPTSTESPWHRVSLSQGQQQQLAEVGNEFAVAVGLAQRRNKDSV